MTPNTEIGAGDAFRSRYLLVVAGIYAALLLLTSCQYWGDTYLYVGQIVSARHGRINPVQLWDFGHLFWRPAANSLSQMMPLSWFQGDERVSVSFAFALLSSTLSFLAALSLFGLAWFASRSFWISTVTALSLICCNTFLNLFQGSCYPAALGFASLALCLCLSAVERELPLRYAVWAGLSLCAAMLIWLPFCLIAPAIVMGALVWRGSPQFWRRPDCRQRLLFSVLLTAATVIPLAAAYAWAIRLHGFSSVADVKNWIVDAQNALGQNRNLLRFFFGFPRTFLDMGTDGILFKRYLFHDPYAQVTLFDLVRLSLIKIVAFYTLAAWMIIRLFRQKTGRQILAMFATAAAVVFFFALVLFETGAPERFIGLLPFVALSLAGALSQETVRPLRIAVAACLVAVSLSAVVQLRSHATNTVEAAERRIGDLKPRLVPGSVLWVLTSLEDVYHFAVNNPYHPLNRPDILPVDDLIFAGSPRQKLWREDFAFTTLRAFDGHAEVLLSPRLLASRPQPAWNWTEGDSLYVHWADLRPFLSQLDYGETVNGPDGFTLIPDTPHNRQFLGQVLAKGLPRPTSEHDPIP
ncbi:MAG: hypothetical protein ABI693_03365 [Bryobacteraceae bacterium]